MTKHDTINNRIQTRRIIVLLTAMALLSGIIYAQNAYVQRLGIEGRMGYIFPTSPFIRGENDMGKYISTASSAHLKYSFQNQPGTVADQIYGGAYQGLGLGYFNFGNSKEMGNPVALYLFQGARIAKFTPRLSLNYEWGFGASFGWKPYHQYNNPNNTVMGSKINAYLNAGMHLNYILSPRIDLNVGVTAIHFSNGNTKFPNTGLNTVDFKVGLVYNFNRENNLFVPKSVVVPSFPQHISYDLTMFGSWRRKAVNVTNGQVPVPDTYEVAGFSFAPMYNLGYKYRVGVAVDGVYDASANIYAKNNITDGSHAEGAFGTPSLDKQLSLGVSARGEFVMPYLTVGIGFGANILHGGGDMQSFYQILALKIDVAKNSYLHIGYNLRDFHEPNYLMLGFGYRFNNKRPCLSH